jgi:hypothetical protein
MQERSTSVDVSSPTVSTEAFFLSLAIDAKEKRHVVTVDIEGAYLHASMQGEVIVELDPIMSAILQQLDAYYSDYVAHDHKLYVILDKALYGCIESAKLFYDHISGSLVAFGFLPNPYDPCVFNRSLYGQQCTITLHVDDLKISCSDGRGVTDVLNELTSVYKKINVHEGKILDYLGMDLDYSESGVVSVSMTSMIEDAIDTYGIDGTAASPAANYLFNISPTAEPLLGIAKQNFHSMVQRLLYISKRARPDILTAVSFLTTRVTTPTIEDNNKLIRVLKYLNGTSDLKLRLSSDDGMVVTSYIDASFGVHPDGKGHTGIVVSLGGGAVYAKSGKQKLVARSSTEAELVGLSDGLSQVIWTRNFLEKQGHQVGPAVVHQDNKSTMALAEKGRSTSGRTRHVSIRYFFVKDRIDSKEIELRYIGTEEMIADFFTKPLQGALFKSMRSKIMNHDMVGIAGVC